MRSYFLIGFILAVPVVLSQVRAGQDQPAVRPALPAPDYALPEAPGIPWIVAPALPSAPDAAHSAPLPVPILPFLRHALPLPLPPETPRHKRAFPPMNNALAHPAGAFLCASNPFRS